MGNMDGQNIREYDYWQTFFSCEIENTTLFETTVSEHMLAYIFSGEMELISSTRRIHVKKGEAVFIRKNHLMKKLKKPEKSGEKFKGLFLQLKAPFLKKMLSSGLVQIPPTAGVATSAAPYVELGNHPLLTGLFLSLNQYFASEQHPSK